MNVTSHRIASILTADLDDLSVKRIAWAFGCAKKDSDEEIALYKLLLDKLERIRAERSAEAR